MKFAFLIIAIFINFVNPSLIKSEERIDSIKNTKENIFKKESITEDKTDMRKIHIVKIGDTISSVSSLYSIKKDLIIQLNNLKDENYIYVGQNLIIPTSNQNYTQQSDLKKSYHIVQIGDNLTEISNKYNLNLSYLIEINNLKNPDSIKIGQKILLSKHNPTNSEDHQIFQNTNTNELPELDKRIYGPIIIQSKSYKEIKGKKILNVLNQDNKKLILAIDCDAKELDLRIPGRKWMGVQAAKEEFEKNLINDFCQKF